MFAGVAQSIPSFGDLSWKQPALHLAFGPLLANTLAPAAGISPGQTLTANANGSIDSDPSYIFAGAGSAIGDRVLVTDEASPKNGIYSITAVGDATHPWRLTRTTDANTAALLPTGTVCLARVDGSIWVGSTTTWASLPGSTYAVQAGAQVVAVFLRRDRSFGAIIGKLPIVHVYTASTTWTPPADLLYAVVECVGGGGGGGGCALTAAGQAAVGGAGGGGGYARKLLAASALSGSYTVTVGTGGGGGTAAPTGGSNGNITSFAGAGITTVQANGGTGGAAGSAAASGIAAGGVGGGSSGGDANAVGGDGTHGRWLSALPVQTGLGGASVFGGARHETAVGTGGTGTNGNRYGGGATGGLNFASQAAGQPGGTGADGVVIVTEYYGP